MTKLEIERRGEDKWCVVADLAQLGPTPVLRWIKSKRAAQEAMERLYTLPVRWDMDWREDSRRPERSGWRLADRATCSILLDEQVRVLGV
jgi:hypothetical protein